MGFIEKTVLLTKSGYAPISDLCTDFGPTTVIIWNGCEWEQNTITAQKVKKIFITRISQWLYLGTDDAQTFNDRKILDSAGLIFSKIILPEIVLPGPAHTGYADGLYTGLGKDGGTITIDNIHVQNILPYLSISAIERGFKQSTLYLNKYTKAIPFGYSNKYKAAWIAGLLDSRGKITPDQYFIINSPDVDFLRNVRIILAELCIVAYLTSPDTLKFGCTKVFETNILPRQICKNYIPPIPSVVSTEIIYLCGDEITIYNLSPSASLHVNGITI